jgi:hypothetical protein
VPPLFLNERAVMTAALLTGELVVRQGREVDAKWPMGKYPLGSLGIDGVRLTRADLIRSNTDYTDTVGN